MVKVTKYNQLVGPLPVTKLTGLQRDVLVIAGRLDYEGSYLRHIGNVSGKKGNTITSTITSIFDKLGVFTMPAALAAALDRGIVTLDALISAGSEGLQDASSETLVARISAETRASMSRLYKLAKENPEFGKGNIPSALALEAGEFDAVIAMVSAALGFRPNHVQLVVIGYACATAEAISQQPA